jgi:hypothetical protein
LPETVLLMPGNRCGKILAGVLLTGLLTACGPPPTARFSNPEHVEVIRIQYEYNLLKGIGSDAPGSFLAYDESGFWGRLNATEIGWCRPATRANWVGDSLRFVPHWYHNELTVDVYEAPNLTQKLGSLHVAARDSAVRQRLDCEDFRSY